MNLLPFWITIDKSRPGREVEHFLGSVRPYGVILFARHLESKNQVIELCQCLHESVPGNPPRIAVDQEGGRVSRVTGLGYNFPGAETLKNDPSVIESNAYEMGELLAYLGFDVNFAPVADLGPAADGTGLETRLYGEDAKAVSIACEAFLNGLDRAGIEGCLKHFPGLGGSRVDSHKTLPQINGTEQERAEHVVPYYQLASRVPYVMVSHASYEAYDDKVPASLSSKIYSLLKETGFQGMSVTDDLSMGALSEHGALEDLVRKSIGSGADLALWVSAQEETLRIAESLSSDTSTVEASARLCKSIGGG